MSVQVSFHSGFLGAMKTIIILTFDVFQITVCKSVWNVRISVLLFKNCIHFAIQKVFKQFVMRNN